MGKQKLILIIVAVVVLALVLIFGLRGDRLSEQDESFEVGEPTRVPIRGDASRIKVPEVGEEQGGGDAVPTNVGPGDPSGATDSRNFEIRAEGGHFSPPRITVYHGDTININITAVDGDYDFYQPDYGLSADIRRGSTKKIQFAATVDGKYTYYCRSCNSPDGSTVVGYIIVVPR